MQPYKILVADDNESIRWMLVQTLLQAGYHVIEAANGKIALALLGDKAVDLILSDIDMPEGDGFYLLKEIKTRFSQQIPVVFISGNTSVSIADAKALGAQGLFPKPFHARDLIDWIRQWRSSLS